MNLLPLRIAFRYLISKKSTNAINIISGVSMLGMACGSLALVLVLSVFNGFEGLVISLYQSINPDIEVTAKEGKVFKLENDELEKIAALEGVEFISQALEENAILRYNDNEYIATIKGVDAYFVQISQVSGKMIGGEFLTGDQNKPYAVVGAGVAGALALDLDNRLNAISIFLPKRGKTTMALDPSQAFIRKTISPSGVFSIQQEFDNKYVFVPLEFTRDLLKYVSELSSLEIKLYPGANKKHTQNQIAAIMGDRFHVKDRFEQNEFLYRVMRSEKWAVFAILSFILIIAAFNIIGSLSMLVIEKTKDIAVLKAMGATKGLIRRIFLWEGMLTSLIGSFTGIILGIIICWIQINFEVIKLQGSGTFVIDSYPVVMKASDFVLVAVTVITISILTSWVPAHRAALQNAIISPE